MCRLIVIEGSKGIGNKIVTSLLSAYTEVINISRTAQAGQINNLNHYNYDVINDELPKIESADSINLKPINRLSLNDFKINIIGAVKAIQKYLPALKNDQKPSIILFSTVATKLGLPFHVIVMFSKSTVEGLTKSLRVELGATIRVNTIDPTVTDTELTSKLLRNERMIDNINEGHLFKKYLRLHEVANIAASMLSEKAASLSGQIFKMDCGTVSFKI